MNLRLRLILVFFLLSVVPLGAVTFYTYQSNASAMRDAAGHEAELLAGELTEQMKLVTSQLSNQFERLMDIPASAQARAASPSSPDTPPAAKSVLIANAAAVSQQDTSITDESTHVAEQLGEVAMLLNNIEVRGFGRGRGGRSRGQRPPGPERALAFTGERGQRGGPPAPPPGVTDSPNSPPRFGAGRRSDGPPSGGRGFDGPPPDVPADPSRIQIDLGPVRREILQQFSPDRERWDQLSPDERELIMGKVNERMLGIQQGIQIIQQKASERAADARTAAATAAPQVLGGTPERGALRETAAATQAQAAATPRHREVALSGTQMDVKVMQEGEVLGQVKAEINMPNLLATVFRTTRRDRGEVPFAVEKNGTIYTPTDADRVVITSLKTTASQPAAPPGTVLLQDWAVATTADPTGSGLKFGIARPLSGALDELRRLSARNAALGLGFIVLALIGIVPLSSRLTRNLSRLSDGVNRLATGDYGTRVDVSSKDEIGRLAVAFNRMAGDVERHQRSAVMQERLRRELELGRQIQHDMLPQAPLRLGLTEIRGVSVPATEVGGDFFNYFQTPSGKIALVVGDVSGKGVGAALLMANIQASLRTRFALGQDLASLAHELDADIGDSTPGAVYATLFVGLLDPEQRTLDYVNAGHNPQFVMRDAGGLERMGATGLPIGLLAGRGYGQGHLALAAGDVVFFYTDGCVEAENMSGEMFGSARLEESLIRCAQSSCDDVLVQIERDMLQFRAGREPFDDATMMVVRVG